MLWVPTSVFSRCVQVNPRGSIQSCQLSSSRAPSQAWTQFTSPPTPERPCPPRTCEGIGTGPQPWLYVGITRRWGPEPGLSPTEILTSSCWRAAWASELLKAPQVILKRSRGSDHHPQGPRCSKCGAESRAPLPTYISTSSRDDPRAGEAWEGPA